MDPSKSRLCGEIDETVDYIISEYNKLAQTQFKSNHDWVGNGI